jgi:MoaA/NifB/PqqE/SkfB family radical SAM enzyme
VTRWLELAPDYRCNQRCIGCAVTGEEGPRRSSTQLVRAMTEGRAMGITQLWIGGGEPTLRRDLAAVVREARTLGYTRIRLQTNAAMLAYPAFVERLREAGVTEIAASIKGADAAAHDRMTRTEGSFELLLRGIANARDAGLAIEGDVLLYRSTTSSLPAIVRTFHALGVERFRVWSMAPDAADADALREEPRMTEIARAVEETLALGLSDDPLHVVSLHTPPCLLRDGAARARFFAPDLALLVHDASGRSFRLEESEMEGGTYPSRCAGCTLRSRCGGMRRAYLDRHGDDELRPSDG